MPRRFHRAVSTVLAVLDLGLMVATVAGASDQIPTPPFYSRES